MTTTQEVTAWRVTDMFTFLRGENYQIVKQWFQWAFTSKASGTGSQGNFMCYNVVIKGVRTEIMSATSMSISTAVAWAGKQNFDLDITVFQKG